VKVFLDECVDWRLARDIVGHDVKTARQMGWTTIKNGTLLTLASEQFDVFVTVDRNLSFQQNLDSFSIAVVVLQAKTTGLPISGRWFQVSWWPSGPHRPAPPNSLVLTETQPRAMCRRAHDLDPCRTRHRAFFQLRVAPWSATARISGSNR
jgi:hypothetical protein